MKGYSKIKLIDNNKTRSMSMDFSDQTIITPRFQKLISHMKPTTKITQEKQQQQPKTQQSRDDDDDDDDDYSHYSSNNPQEQQVDNFPNDQILTKNQSVATNRTPNKDANAKSSRFKIEKQNSTGRTLHTSVLRALSIRRSSSVSERYARIHDQYSSSFDIDSCHEEQEEEIQETRSKVNTKKQKKRSILKVCKRIFGL